MCQVDVFEDVWCVFWCFGVLVGIEFVFFGDVYCFVWCQVVDQGEVEYVQGYVFGGDYVFDVVFGMLLVEDDWMDCIGVVEIDDVMVGDYCYYCVVVDVMVVYVGNCGEDVFFGGLQFVVYCQFVGEYVEQYF